MNLTTTSKWKFTARLQNSNSKTYKNDIVDGLVLLGLFYAILWEESGISGRKLVSIKKVTLFRVKYSWSSLY